MKGKIKEKAGQVTDTADEGQNEKVAGKVQEKVGQIEQVLEEGNDPFSAQRALLRLRFGAVALTGDVPLFVVRRKE